MRPRGKWNDLEARRRFHRDVVVEWLPGYSPQLNPAGAAGGARPAPGLIFAAGPAAQPASAAEFAPAKPKPASAPPQEKGHSD